MCGEIQMAILGVGTLTLTATMEEIIGISEALDRKAEEKESKSGGPRAGKENLNHRVKNDLSHQCLAIPGSLFRARQQKRCAFWSNHIATKKGCGGIYFTGPFTLAQPTWA